MLGVKSCSQTQNGGCSSAPFIMEIVRYLGSPPPPFQLSFWQCTFQREQSKLASLLALWMTCWKELLWIAGGGGIGGVTDREGQQRRWLEFLSCPVCVSSMLCHIAPDWPPPLNQHAAASPGSCISHARPSQPRYPPLLVQEGAQKILEEAEAPHRVQGAQGQRAKRQLLNEACYAFSLSFIWLHISSSTITVSCLGCHVSHLSVISLASSCLGRFVPFYQNVKFMSKICLEVLKRSEAQDVGCLQKQGCCLLGFKIEPQVFFIHN